MMKEDYTHPPCNSCHAHDDLEDKFIDMKDNNRNEHSEILTQLDKTISNIQWMNVIGKWILATMLGYFVAIGYYIFTRDHVSSKDIQGLTSEVKNGEKLHYENENQISVINGKLDILINKHEKDKK